VFLIQHRVGSPAAEKINKRIIANSLFEIELKCNPDVGKFLADHVST
jgi:hypothetical protein